LDGMFDNKIQNELENHFHSELYSWHSVTLLAQLCV
jgi:hypothetical protein